MKIIFVFALLLSSTAFANDHTVTGHIADNGWVKIEGPVAKELYEKLTVAETYGELADLYFKYGKSYRCQTNKTDYYGCDIFFDDVAKGKVTRALKGS